MTDKAYELTFDGEAADTDLYEAVDLLEVEECVTAPSAFHLHLSIALNDNGQWSFVDDERFSLFTKVGIAIGFSASPALPGGGSAAGVERIMEGYVTEVAVHLGATPGDAYLDIRGLDASVLMSLEEKVVAWPNLADSDIAQQIVAGYGFDIDATSTSPVHQDTDVLTLQRGTDAQFLRQLADRNGFLFTFSQGSGEDQVPCYFGPPKLNESPQPDLAIQFGQDTNLVSFGVDLSGVRPLAVSAAQVDPRSKTENDGDATGSNLTPLGGSGLSDLVSDKLDELVTPLQQQAAMLLLPQPTSDATELDAVTQAVRDQSEWLISASGEVNSDAYSFVLRAGRLVLVKGAGSQHSGAYFVTRVTHVLTHEGSYLQRFEALRNARDLLGTEQFGGGPGGVLGVPAGL